MSEDSHASSTEEGAIGGLGVSPRTLPCRANTDRLASLMRRPTLYRCSSQMPPAQGAAGQCRRRARLSCGGCAGGGPVGEGLLGQAGLQVSAAGRGADVIRQAQAAHGAVQGGQPTLVLAAPACPASVPLVPLSLCRLTSPLLTSALSRLVLMMELQGWRSTVLFTRNSHRCWMPLLLILAHCIVAVSLAKQRFKVV